MLLGGRSGQRRSRSARNSLGGGSDGDLDRATPADDDEEIAGGTADDSAAPEPKEEADDDDDAVEGKPGCAHDSSSSHGTELHMQCRL